MIRKCKFCGKEKEMHGKQLYCDARCKKNYENSLRSGPRKKKEKINGLKKESHSQNNNHTQDINITKPDSLNPVASSYWDKLAPLLIKRGHLNILSEDAFAELCDLHSRLVDIRAMIDAGTALECPKCKAEIITPGNRSLLQIDDKWSANDSTQTQTFKESALSDLKRKYSQRFLDYCKQFYLTPAANRGNFGLEEDEKDNKEADKDRFFN
jgi:phage terminase small subunit